MRLRRNKPEQVQQPKRSEGAYVCAQTRKPECSYGDDDSNPVAAHIRIDRESAAAPTETVSSVRGRRMDLRSEVIQSSRRRGTVRRKIEKPQAEQEQPGWQNHERLSVAPAVGLRQEAGQPEVVLPEV